jgi:macrolide-specific efflux system membrane fusion protein
MSFLRRLPLILRRIPPLPRRPPLLPRRLFRRRSAARGINRPALLVNTILIALLLIGLLLAYRTVAIADAAMTDSGGTGLVSRGLVTASISAGGTVQSGSMANVSFASPGTVTELNVKLGDVVKKDQVLARVDPSQAQEQLSAAQATLVAAQQSLRRVRASTSDATTIAFAETQVTNAQNAVNAAQRTLAGTTLNAPMGGTVIAVNGTVGSWANATTTGSGPTAVPAASGGGALIQIADVGKLQISASVPEVDAVRFKTDQAATVTWAALSHARAAGRVTAIAPAATSQNNVNSYAVTISLGWLPDGARIGQTVTVAVTVAQVDGAIRVPLAGVRDIGQRHTVEVIRADGKRETRDVEIGLRGDQFVEIKTGLALGEQVTLSRDRTRGDG